MKKVNFIILFLSLSLSSFATTFKLDGVSKMLKGKAKSLFIDGNFEPRLNQLTWKGPFESKIHVSFELEKIANDPILKETLSPLLLESRPHPQYIAKISVKDYPIAKIPDLALDLRAAIRKYNRDHFEENFMVSASIKDNDVTVVMPLNPLTLSDEALSLHVDSLFYAISEVIK